MMNKSDRMETVFREGRIGLVAMIGFGFLVNMLMLATPLYMIQIFDRVLGSGSYETLLFLTLFVILALIAMGGLEAVRKFLQDRMGTWLDDRMSPLLLEASMKGTLSGLPANVQSLRDLASVRQFVTGGLRPMTDVIWVPLFLIAITFLHGLLGIFAVTAGAILVAIAALNEVASRDPSAKASEERVRNLQLADIAVRNADVIHAMGMFSHFRKGWQQRNDKARLLQQAAADTNGVLFGISRFLRMGAQIGILGLGAFLVLKNQMTPGGMIAGSILLARALGPLEQAIGTWRGFLSARSAYTRIKSLLVIVDISHTQKNLPAPSGQLSCEKVTLVPKGQTKPALSEISFQLDAGEILGVLGPSSAGKTTLCKILVGTWKPDEGHARLDGVDVFAWDSEELGPNIGYLPQDVELFSATIKENIARLDPDADPKQIQEAAQLANVHNMILKLPDGYDTEIGDGMLRLSGGQRQRIGLARALYGRPKLLVLDEPNSNLDSEGEEALVDAISKAKEWGATIVLVTHQVRLLRPVTKVLVLQFGKAQLFGDRDEILEKLRFKQVQVLQSDTAPDEKKSTKTMRKIADSLKDGGN